ncbi:cytochrome P450 [Mucidula mucida]|nr:cytochrome P450 [Mucidula mucida]
MDNQFFASYVLLVSAILFLVWKYSQRIPQFPLPPGPRQWPLIGNYHQLPVLHPWKTYAEWAKVYGPVTHLRFFSKTTIILNTGKAAIDLLEARSSLYSDRPVWVMGALAGRQNSAFHISYDHPRFRSYRKMLHSGLNARAIDSYRPIQEAELRSLMQNLSQTPDKFISHLRRNAAGVVLKVAYGYEVSPDNDHFINSIENFFSENEKALGRPYLVDFVPLLRFLPEWLPFVKFKRIAREYKSLNVEGMTYNWAKKLIASGNYMDSFVSHFLQREGQLRSPGEEEEDAIKWCSAALYLGGADTTVSVMTSFFYLMAVYPDVQKRAQAEIENTLGAGHLPTLDDRDAMPFVRALIKEVIRWGPVAPLGLRHRAKEDDVYSGFHIPKDATVIANIWGITHDPELYADPHTFKPDRHLGAHPETDPYKFVFGFGRRACPGVYLAELSLFLNISNILATSNIGKPMDSLGHDEIAPEMDWTNATVTHLKPFKCTITPRSPHVLSYL